MRPQSCPDLSPSHLPRRVLAALCALLLATPAGAATYHVAPGGNDAASGLSPTSPWRTLAKANATVRPGDVVLVAPGTYADYPSPATSGTADRRITYVGSLAAPSTVRADGAATAIAASHVTLKGFHLARGMSLAGVRDSVAWCLIGGDRPQIAAADDAVLAHCTVIAQRFWFMGGEVDSFPRAERDTITDCVFRLSPVTAAGHTMRLRNVDGGLLARNRFVIDIAATARNASPTKFFFVRGLRIEDCSWDVTCRVLDGGDEAGWFVLRDFTQNTRWVRDTVVLKGPGPVQFFASASGSYPGTVMNNDFESCVFRQSGPAAYGSALHFQDHARWDTLRACVVVGEHAGLSFNASLDRVLVEGCTIVGFDPWLGALDLETGAPWSGLSAVRNSIVYTAFTATRSREHAPLAARVAALSGHLVANHNLYYGPMARDSVIYGTDLGPSAPGVGRPWCTAARADSQSITGSPRFADSSSVLAFDARLGTGSAALGAGLNGSDIGALGAAGPDLVPPGSVADLRVIAVTPSAAALSWTAPGDDAGAGRATAYDLRWSPQPITASSFNAATPVPAAPLPLHAGTPQSATVTDLPSNSSIYFALKARDEAGNWSGLSNVPGAQTPPDTIAPAAVTSLGVGR